ASAGAFLVCTAIWLTSGANGQFWPIWVALVAVIPLVRNGWRLYGPAPELDRVEEELTPARAWRPRPALVLRSLGSALLLVPDVIRLDDELDPLFAGLAERVLVLADVLLAQAVDG